MSLQLKSMLYLIISVTLISKVIGPAFDNFYPVVTTLTITERQPFRGFLEKQRNCEFKQGYAKVWTDDVFEIKEIKFLEMPSRIYSRPTGVQKFGPWVVDIPDNVLRVSFVFEHMCSPFWKHTTREFMIYERTT